jgi:hypothetical protein
MVERTKLYALQGNRRVQEERGDGMKYSDGFYQDLRLISPRRPTRSTETVEALIERYKLDTADINIDFLIGFQTAIEIISEKLREERE